MAMASAASGARELTIVLHIGGGLGFGVVSFGDLNLRQYFFQQRSEFKFGEELAEEIEIGLAGAHGFDIELDGDIGVDGGHALAEQNDVAIVQQRFAVGFLFDFSGAVERLLDACRSA